MPAVVVTRASAQAGATTPVVVTRASAQVPAAVSVPVVITSAAASSLSAGPAQTVDALDVVTLTASAPVTWAQTTGTPVTLTVIDPTTATFTAPAARQSTTLGFTAGGAATTVTVRPHGDWYLHGGAWRPLRKSIVG